MKRYEKKNIIMLHHAKQHITYNEIYVDKVKGNTQITKVQGVEEYSFKDLFTINKLLNEIKIIKYKKATGID